MFILKKVLKKNSVNSETVTFEHLAEKKKTFRDL